jgi:predicted GIY-YIG superfamily endonuclease
LDAKLYFGVSCNPTKRFDGHCSKPPHRMQPYLKGRDFRFVVHMRVLEEFSTLHDAEKREAELIRTYMTTNIRNGYNTLDSKPGWSRKWWWLHRRGLLPNQVFRCEWPTLWTIPLCWSTIPKYVTITFSCYYFKMVCC